MTEIEAKEALFKLHLEYMDHTPKERLKLYEEYKQKRNLIKESLLNFVNQERESVRTISG